MEDLHKRSEQQLNDKLENVHQFMQLSLEVVQGNILRNCWW